MSQTRTKQTADSTFKNKMKMCIVLTLNIQTEDKSDRHHPPERFNSGLYKITMVDEHKKMFSVLMKFKTTFYFAFNQSKVLEMLLFT